MRVRPIIAAAVMAVSLASAPAAMAQPQYTPDAGCAGAGSGVTCGDVAAATAGTPSGNLARTGSSTVPIGVAGAAFVAAGGGLVVLSRRRGAPIGRG